MLPLLPTRFTPIEPLAIAYDEPIARLTTFVTRLFLDWPVRLWQSALPARPPALEALATYCSLRPAATELSRAARELEDFLASVDLRAVAITPLVRQVHVFAWRGVRLIWKAGALSAARERSAYLVDGLLGHAARVLPVLLCREGALSFYLEHAQPAYLDPRRPYLLQNPERPEYARLAFLDCLIGNRDRHAGNWLISAAGTTLPIDHANAFPSRNGPQKALAYDFSFPVRLREKELQGLETVRARAPGLLTPLLGEERVAALLERLEKMLAEQSAYAWHDGAGAVYQDSLQAGFAADSGLDLADLVLSDPDGYGTLRAHIDVHHYYLGRELARDVSWREAAASWQARVYAPVLQVIRETGLDREFPRRTGADLYLWVTYHRERMEGASDREVARALRRRFSERPWRRAWTTLRRMWLAIWESPEPRASLHSLG